MSAKTIHFKEEVTERIIELFKKANISVVSSQIKIWGCDNMQMKDAAKGCQFVKSLNEKLIIFTNKVPHLKYLERNESIIIYDQERVQELALDFKDYETYDLLS